MTVIYIYIYINICVCANQMNWKLVYQELSKLDTIYIPESTKKKSYVELPFCHIMKDDGLNYFVCRYCTPKMRQQKGCQIIKLKYWIKNRSVVMLKWLKL